MATSPRVRERDPAPDTRGEYPEAGRLIEGFVPRDEADVAERHAIEVDAPAGLALQVAEEFDLLSIPLVRGIFRLRAKVLGAPPPGRDDLRGLVRQTKRMGWRELARRPGREVVMGASVQPWLPEPVFEPIPPERFLSYREPKRVKIAWTLEAEPLEPGRCRLGTETRIQATDEEARKRFRGYWRFAAPGIVLVRLLALPAMRREAEERRREDGGEGDGAGPGAAAAPDPTPRTEAPSMSERIRIEQHSMAGTLWFAAWLFTIGFLDLSFWRGVLAIIAWPYYLGVTFSALLPGG